MYSTSDEACVSVPFAVVLSAVEHVVTLQKSVHRAEDHRTHHNVQRRRPAFSQQGEYKRPAGAAKSVRKQRDLLSCHFKRKNAMVKTLIG